MYHSQCSRASEIIWEVQNTSELMWHTDAPVSLHEGEDTRVHTHTHIDKEEAILTEEVVRCGI